MKANLKKYGGDMKKCAAAYLVAAPPLLLQVAEPPALRAKEPARERRRTCESS